MGNFRIGSGIYPLQTGTTTSANQEIVNNILTINGSNSAFSVVFLPDNPCAVSINGGEYQTITLLETNPYSVGIHSLKIQNSGVSHKLQVEW